jgi:D-alanyl-D-alanine carboxypeptidase (penicillin-binding protein 5/6)
MSAHRARIVIPGFIAALMLPAVGVADAQPAPSPCSHAEAPPPAVDTSEDLPPGVPRPEPLPVPENTVGGERLKSCELITPTGAPEVPAEVSSPSWLLADIDSGEVVAAKAPHARLRPASTIKILTSLLAVQQLKMDDTIVATQADADQEGSSVGLVPGVTYSVRQVLTGLLLQSGNDAAHALAVKMGGVEATVAKMNALAAKIGGLDTRAATPSGLDGPGMSTSSYDLALYFQHALRNPDFTQAVGTRQIELPGRPGQPPMMVGTDNTVVLNYPGAIGGKTGFTDDARHTFVAAAERNGRRLVAVLMNGETRQAAQTMALLDYGFGLGRTEAIGTLAQPEPAKPNPADPHQHGPYSPQSAPAPNMFGTVGGPLTLLAVAGVAMVGVLGFRRRRAKLAATARRNSAEIPHDRP